MIVKAPVNSLRSAELQCKYGAKEIYLGLRSDKLNRLSFSGRGSIKVDKKGSNSNIESGEELNKIISHCHEKGVSVALAANCPSLPDAMKDGYEEYINEVIELGVDSIIVGDLASLILVRKIVPKDFYVTASVFMESYNIGVVQMLKHLGANEVYIPHHLKYDEIEKICDEGLNIGVFANYGCSFSNGRCGLIHRWGEEIDMGIPCRAKFDISSKNGSIKDAYSILDFGLDCCLCTIKKLMDFNIHSLKLIDRATPVEQVLPFTKVYSTAIKMFQEGKNLDEIKVMAFKTVPWWENQFCATKNCRYMDNCYSSYYI